VLGSEKVADTRRRSIRRRNSQVRAEEQVPITADDLQRRLDPVLRAGEQAEMLGVVRHLEANNVQLTEARSSFRVCRVVEHARNTLA